VSLIRLSVITILGCLLGLAVLLGLGLMGLGELRSAQRATDELVRLSSRMDEISAATDYLMLYRSDAGLRAAVIAQIGGVEEGLRSLGTDDPDVGRAIRVMDLLLDGVKRLPQATELQPGPPAAAIDDLFGPAGVSVRARAIISRIGGHGVALDTIMDRLVSARRAEIARSTIWVAGLFVASAFLFGGLCVVAFAWIHQRLSVPIRSLMGTIERVAAGDSEARATLRGRDELARLGAAFNRMLDRRQRDAARIAEAQALMQIAGDIAHFGGWAHDLGSEVVLWSDQVCAMHEMPPGTRPSLEAALAFVGPGYREQLRHALVACAREGRPFDLALRLATAGGRRIWVRSTGQAVRNAAGLIVRLQGALQDITEQRRAEDQLRRVAFRDHATGLLSRAGFLNALSRRLETRARAGLVIMLDIRRLQDINHAYGYAAGDALLAGIGRRLRRQSGPGWLVARAGGDEFLVWLPLANGLDDERVCVGVGQLLNTPFEIADNRITVDADVGYTRVSGADGDPARAIREAELALFASRRDGTWECLRFTERMESDTRDRIALTEELRGALDRGELRLHFQPQVDLAPERIIGAEALVRWERPGLGLIPPGRFIPIAEQSQLIGPIGAWVLQQACVALDAWTANGLELGRVSVNVSLVQFHMGDFVAQVRRTLEATGIDPGRLTLELTESVFRRDPDWLAVRLDQLHDLGVHLSLDDFGTGYSSLGYLQRYRFDEVKIDRAFVSGLARDLHSRRIIEAIIGIAETMDMAVVAEGIEVPEQREMLLQMGCRIGQGFRYARPLPEAELLALVGRQPAADAIGAWRDHGCQGRS